MSAALVAEGREIGRIVRAFGPTIARRAHPAVSALSTLAFIVGFATVVAALQP